VADSNFSADRNLGGQHQFSVFLADSCLFYAAAAVNLFPQQKF